LHLWTFFNSVDGVVPHRRSKTKNLHNFIFCSSIITAISISRTTICWILLNPPSFHVVLLPSVLTVCSLEASWRYLYKYMDHICSHSKNVKKKWNNIVAGANITLAVLRENPLRRRETSDLPIFRHHSSSSILLLHYFSFKICLVIQYFICLFVHHFLDPFVLIKDC
jgi:hypothetical protein